MTVFASKEQSKESKYARTQTNSRYSHFRQQQYTIGDEEQFLSFIKDIEEWPEEYNIIDDHLNIFKSHDFTFPELYRRQEKINILQTFRYIFYKFKKGIYIRIQNNRVSKFAPMSNANFVNEWSQQIQIDYDVFQQVSRLDNRPYNERSINKFVKSWFCNNCLLRYEYPVNESDTNVANILNFFEELCKHRKVPDIDFFVNKRDFPLLTKDLTEPYYDIWGRGTPLVSHHYDSYLPILSMSKTDAYNDLLIPTHEDWARALQHDEGKWFVDSRVEDDNRQKEDVDFHNKKPIAVFRGSSTGDGFTIDTNTRLRLAYLSSLQKKQDDGNNYLDCGITKWNSRVKKLEGSNKIQVIDPTTLPFTLVDYLPLSDQRMYKYVVHVDGHVSAFRLSGILRMNCVVLMVESDWKMWYSDMLIPYEHYIPVKKDLSDIYEQIDWCRENDQMCELIAYNAQQFAERVLGKNGMLDYTQKLLVDLKKFMRYESMSLVVDPPMEPHDVTPRMEKEVFFENRNVIIYKVVDKPLVFKKKKSPDEQMIWLPMSVNNFCDVYGLDEDGHLVMDYVDGIKFYDYLASPSFKFETYLDILIQLGLALHEAQTKMLFVHNDLTPWNIILQMYNHDQRLRYCDDKYHYSAKVVPVIIDFDKSHYIDKHYIHRGTVNRFRFSTIQDVMSLLFTSLYQIMTSQTLSKTEVGMLLKLGNFVSKTQFCPESFMSIHSLKHYLYSMKKHSSLLYTDKKDMDQVGPLDFVAYIYKMRNRKFVVTKRATSDDDRIDYDEYDLLWSPSRSRGIREKVSDQDVTKLMGKKDQNIDILRKIANIETVKSIYK
jgi:hypothetical protein